MALGNGDPSNMAAWTCAELASFVESCGASAAFGGPADDVRRTEIDGAAFLPHVHSPTALKQLFESVGGSIDDEPAEYLVLRVALMNMDGNAAGDGDGDDQGEADCGDSVDQRSDHSAFCPRAATFDTAEQWLRCGDDDREAVALTLVRQAAQQHKHPRALFLLGEALCHGHGGIQPDELKAAVWFRAAGLAGDTEAQVALARMYTAGSGVQYDMSQAASWYLRAAKQGVAFAQHMTGKFLYEGKHVDKDTEKAAQWFLKAAEQGFAEAQYILGVMFEKGQGVDTCYASAVKWYLNAANQNHSNAQCDVARLYQEGRGVDKDAAEAVEWYRKAAQQGFAKGQFSLAQAYETGIGVPPDLGEALAWYSRAAEQGHLEAQLSCARICAHPSLDAQQGHGAAEAANWYRMAAEGGHVESMHMLGCIYSDGVGVPPDLVAGVKWLRIAARRGHVRSNFCLGVLYESGVGAEPDPETAMHWYQRAAEAGHAEAQCRLGDAYRDGCGVEQDTSKAAIWWRKAAQTLPAAQLALGIHAWKRSGDATEKFTEAYKWLQQAAQQRNPTAEYLCAILLEEGLGVRQNTQKARDLYKRAADYGLAAAKFALAVMAHDDTAGPLQYTAEQVAWCRQAAEQEGFLRAYRDLGRMYFDGNGVERDFAEAAKWYGLAAEHGDMEAQCALARMFDCGYGVPADPAQCANWCLKAAEQGHAPSQVKIARMYELGAGVAQNPTAALCWFNKAAKQEYPLAKLWMAAAKLSGAKGVDKDVDAAVSTFRKEFKREHQQAALLEDTDVAPHYIGGSLDPQELLATLRHADTVAQHVAWWSRSVLILWICFGIVASLAFAQTTPLPTESPFMLSVGVFIYCSYLCMLPVFIAVSDYPPLSLARWRLRAGVFVVAVALVLSFHRSSWIAPKIHFTAAVIFCCLCPFMVSGQQLWIGAIPIGYWMARLIVTLVTSLDGTVNTIPPLIFDMVACVALADCAVSLPYGAMFQWFIKEIWRPALASLAHT